MSYESEGQEAAIERRIVQGRGLELADLVIKGAQVLDVVTATLFESDVAICGDTIVGTFASYDGVETIDGRGLTVVPGFIDSHLHIESSLLTPHEFDRCVLPHGVTTAIWDPHEIANVLGQGGIEYALAGAEAAMMDIRVNLSSCVPASPLETSGARLEIEHLLPFRDHPKVIGLAEFMNFPGVLARDPGCLAKLAAFQDGHIDGHAPLVRGKDLNGYLAAGIRTDHEATSYEEALEKLRKGMSVLIRESSIAKDLHALWPLIQPETSAFIGFCTDDRNPVEIAEEGHIDHMIRWTIAQGVPAAHVYRVASWSAANAFGLRDRGLVGPGKRADLVLLSDYESCEIAHVIAGEPLLARDVFESFSNAIAERENRGETMESNFVSIDKSEITGAEVVGRTAQITLRFVSKLITVTRDRGGAVIDGSPTEIVDLVDVWTFARELNSRDPNWRLVATGS
ncbi:Tim44/TimA family putative adaptor protein [Hansschlegelia beijingensis]